MALLAAAVTLVVAGCLGWELLADCRKIDRTERDREHRRLMDEIGRQP